MVNFDTFFSAQIRGIGGIPQQAMRGVVTGFRGNELLCLLRLNFAPLGHFFPSHQARYFCSLAVQGIASVIVYFLGRGHRGKAPVKLCITAFNFQNCNAEIPSLLGKLLLLRSIVTSKHYDTGFF